MKFDKYKNKKIYFLGIGGISMYAIALFMKSKGAIVWGYDRSESDTIKFLRNNGVEVYTNPDIKNSVGADFCVCTAAIGSGNTEFDNVTLNNIDIIYRGEFLGEIIDSFDNSIGVSGTHGKSTTSGMLSEIFLADNQKNPTILMGAILPKLNSAYKIGGTEDMVFEACEYKDSFLSFRPSISVILNVSLDHTDYFKNIDEMKLSFVKFAKGSNLVVVNKDCENALECAENSSKPFVTYSISDTSADYCARNIKLCSGYTEFEIFKKGEFLSSCKLNVLGKHNLSNAMAAASSALEAGISIETVVTGLNSFKGIKRRFEYLGKINGASVYDDYAHHPDEIIATLNAASSVNPKRIYCVFQPHTYTRLSCFFEQFKMIFNSSFGSSEVFTIFIPTYAAREVNALGYDTEKLAREVENSTFIYSFDEVASYLKQQASADDMVILMGAGDVTDISKKILFD